MVSNRCAPSAWYGTVSLATGCADHRLINHDVILAITTSALFISRDETDVLRVDAAARTGEITIMALDMPNLAMKAKLEMKINDYAF